MQAQSPPQSPAALLFPLSLTPKRCKRASAQSPLSALPTCLDSQALVLAAKRVKEVARFRDSS